MLKAFKKTLKLGKKVENADKALSQAERGASNLAAAPGNQPPGEAGPLEPASEPAGPQEQLRSPTRRVSFAPEHVEASAANPAPAPPGQIASSPRPQEASAAAVAQGSSAAAAAAAEPTSTGAVGEEASPQAGAAEPPATVAAAERAEAGAFLAASLDALSRCTLDYNHDYSRDPPLDGDECCDFGAGPLELGGEGVPLEGPHDEGGEEGSTAHSGLGGSCSTGQLSRGDGEQGTHNSQHLGKSSPELAQRLGEGEQAQGDPEGGAGGGMGLSDGLSTMVYLTEEEEAGGGDAISVLSDGMTEEELAEELSELEQALSALEGEALMGASPGAGRSPGASLDKELKERLGLADDDSDPAGYAKQMVKLYTNLGLKLMDSRKFDDALTMMHKAEAMVENDELWGEGTPNPTKRKRLQAITYNNLGCLFKRRNQPQMALQYLMRALALEEEIGHVQNSSSTHLNICAAYSSLKKYKESLAHAERAIVLLQRQLWSPTASFQDGLLQLTKVLSTASDKRLLSGVNVLAIAYHNAALEHERLGHVREAHVCFTRASTIAMKCLGPRAVLTNSLQRALKAFVMRHHQARGRGAGSGTPRAGSGLPSAQVKVRQTSPKRGSTRSSLLRPPSGSRTTSRSALAASSAKTTLPLDKSGRSFGKEARSGSSGKLSGRA